MSKRSSPIAAAVAVALALLVCGCATRDWLASSGASRDQVSDPNQLSRQFPVRLLVIDSGAAQRLGALQARRLFSEAFATASPELANAGSVVGLGDILGVSVWEAPPATLFSGPIADSSAGTGNARPTSLPEQMVASDGTIDVPFAGVISVAGKSPQQIDAEIERRLQGKANQPQVIVQIVHNNSANVTVVGEVTQSLRMPLTAKGERLLDAIAAAGGVRQPVSKVMVQVTRGAQVEALPLETVIRSPKENVALAAGDVVTVLYQSLSFSALGATGKNEEIYFEAQGISLAQALARAGGAQENLADARGVFLFRFEDPRAMPDGKAEVPTAPDGRVPVVYRLDLKDPASFLISQNFPVRDKDVLYVSTAPSAELQKFLNIVVTSVYSITNLKNL